MPNALLNLLFPPQCLTCDALVPAHGTLCVACWKQVRFITDPICACCGAPFEFAVGEGALCGLCLHARPPYSRARAAFVYDEASRPLILKLKYQDHTYLASIYGTWLASAGQALMDASDVIVPVPLHYFRLVQRRYNQAQLLAAALAKKTGLPLMPHALKRIRPTLHQADLNFAARKKNVHGAFAVPEKMRAKLAGKTVLLVDDVMTTGATLEQCTKALLEAGAASLNVLTLARTVRP